MSDFIQQVDAATSAMRALFEPTPLQHNLYLSAKFGAEIWLKREDLGPVRSYKLRGALTAMKAALDGGATGPFVCASAGNHAQGVAFAARHFGVQAVVFMPVTTPDQKIAKTRAFGGDFIEIRLTGDFFDAALKAAQTYCAQVNGRFLPPFDDEQVMIGQASVAAEIAEQLGGLPDMLLLPIGGGGLAGGVTRYFGNGCTYRFVEPAGATSLAAALAAGGPVTLPQVDNFVDGAAVARIGARNYAALAGFTPDHCMAIPEDRLCETMIDMLNVEGVVLEPAGALAIDALRDLTGIAGKRIVCLVSGGNFDFERLPDVKERALRSAGLKKYFVLRMPQRPGALKEFLNLLGPDDDIARFEYLKKSARNFGSVLIGIETHDPASFPAFTRRMAEAGFSFQDITDNQMLANFIV
ncbi:threonine ammonia-lyase IlvA [Abyssibius alkaniclasticus]|uniref:threonine ammonia-lyase IlvA n=1 Tax=Abyssibius alkaniclasticus TaxID=2881234 RepID=UPI004057F8A3